MRDIRISWFPLESNLGYLHFYCSLNDTNSIPVNELDRLMILSESTLSLMLLLSSFEKRHIE